MIRRVYNQHIHRVAGGPRDVVVEGFDMDPEEYAAECSEICSHSGTWSGPSLACLSFGLVEGPGDIMVRMCDLFDDRSIMP